MASPYIIPAPKFRRRRKGRIGALGTAARPDGGGNGHGAEPENGSASKTTGIPIGAAVAVLLGVLVLSNVK